MGDFNAKHDSWNSGPGNGNGQLLQNWLLSNNLLLLNTNKEPTYQSASTGSLSTLDLTLISPDLIDLVKNWHVGRDLSSDHFPIFFEIPIEQNASARNQISAKFKIREADWDMFKAHTSNCHVADGIEDVEKIIISAAKRCIPMSGPNRKDKPSNIWWTTEISELRKARQKARRQWKKHRTPELRMKYNQSAAKCKRAIKVAKQTSWRSFVNGINSNTPCSAVWKRFKAIQGKPSEKIFQIQTSSGTPVTREKDIADYFNSSYMEKSGNETIWPTHLIADKEFFYNTLNKLMEQDDISNNPFTTVEVKSAIDQLKATTPGEDGVHNAMLQNCSEELTLELILNLNNIWTEGVIPAKWKQATIIPLLKPGKPSELSSSYRPIALTSCVGKLLERVVNNRLIWRMEHFGLLSQQQFGFRPKRSTTDALHFFTESIYNGFSRKECTAAVLIDFEAAFDKVSRVTIIDQCTKLGIKGNMLKFIVDFLKDRTIKTKINDTYSFEGATLNGIPQGSVISPSLFNIALWDLETVMPASVSLAIYADDVTIWATAREPALATSSVQEALENTIEWCKKWGLTISSTKTEVCFFSKRYTHKNYKPLVFMNNIEIPYNKHPTLLGIKLDPKLLWNAHISSIVEKSANRINALKVISGRVWGADTFMLRQFYISFVRSKMLYACEVWGGAAETHIKKLQLMQNCALRICLGCPKTTSCQAMEIELAIAPLDLYIRMLQIKKHFQILATPTLHDFVADRYNSVRQSFYNCRNKPSPELECLRPQTIPTTLNHPPWLRPKIQAILDIPGSLTKQESPMLLKSVSMEMIRERYEPYLLIYTDGSVDKANGRGGAAFYCPEMQEIFLFPCDASSSMNAELLALSAALQFCRTVEQINICILTDSRSALQAIQASQANDYFFRISEIHDLLANLKEKNIVLQWIPSHCGIPGNEKADALASTACNMGPAPEACFSLLQCKRAAENWLETTWNQRWQHCDSGRAFYALQRTPSDPRLHKSIPRFVSSFAARARTGHIVTNKYLHRFKLSNSDLCGVCMLVEESLEHILLQCSHFLWEREILKVKLGEEATLANILSDSKFWQSAALLYRRHRAIGAESTGSSS